MDVKDRSAELQPGAPSPSSAPPKSRQAGAWRSQEHVPPGYKRTEVGVIPKDWDVKPLDTVALATSGKRLPAGYVLTDRETPHPYVRVIDMRPGTISLGDIKYVPTGAFPAIKPYRIFKDDLFISVAGTLGIVGKVPGELSGANLTENADRITNITCSQDFLLHILMSPLIQNTIESLQTIGAQPKLALERIRKFEIPLPPTLAEQQAIAEALSDADALIESLQQLIAKQRALKQGAMQALLTGRQRLPGFTGDWQSVRLGEIAVFHKGKGLPKSALDDNGKFPCIHYGELFTRLREIVHETVSRTNWTHNCFYSIANDVLMPTSDVTPSGLAKASRVVMDGVIIGGDILVIRTDPKVVCGTFLSYVIRNSESQILQLVTGTTVFHLYASDMRKFEFRLPPFAEQQAIIGVLSDMDTEIEALEARLAKARALKAGMMQMLLTGRIRLI